ncbi:hypothetical protein KC734_04590 [candidate division KSB1 bacterium]|nr:hypothetical protein [candidate division KSB1 bacterium]
MIILKPGELFFAFGSILPMAQKEKYMANNKPARQYIPVICNTISIIFAALLMHCESLSVRFRNRTRYSNLCSKSRNLQQKARTALRLTGPELGNNEVPPLLPMLLHVFCLAEQRKAVSTLATANPGPIESPISFSSRTAMVE